MKKPIKNRLYELCEQVIEEYDLFFKYNNIKIKKINTIEGGDGLESTVNNVNTVVFTLSNHSSVTKAVELLLEYKINMKIIYSINSEVGIKLWQIKFNVYLNDNELRKLKINEILT